MKKKHDIRQRRKSDPIAADVDIPLRKFEPEGSISSLTPERLRFTITAYPEDWEMLYCLALTDPEYLGKQILIQLARPVYQEKLEQLYSPMPRGMHARSANGLKMADFMHQARRYAAAAHTVVVFWIKKPKKEWPDYFKKLISGMDKILHFIQTPHKESYDTIGIVSYLLELKYVKEMDDLHLTQPPEADFRRTYLKKNYLDPARYFFDKGGAEMTIEDLFELIL